MRIERSIFKSILIYVFSIALACILTELVWGLTVGAVVGRRFAGDEAFLQNMDNILSNTGIDKKTVPQSIIDGDAWYKTLPQEKKNELDIMIRQEMQNINWFAITFIVSTIAFGVSGFVCVLLDKKIIYVGTIVILSFLVNNPIIRFQEASILSTPKKLFVIVVGQMVACYIFGYIGLLVNKRM